MRQDFWDRRAEQFRQFDGLGKTQVEVAGILGVSLPTVARYATRYGITIGRVKACPEVHTGHTERRREAIVACAERGMTRQEAAAEVGVTLNTISRYCMLYNIDFIHGRVGKDVNTSRAQAMAAMFMSGKTLAEIGALYGLTRERVRQIIARHHGMTRESGGQAVKAERRREAAERRREEKSLQKNGCTFAQYQELVELGASLMAEGATRERTPVGAWNSQRSNARARGIEWSLKIWDWWQLWQQSGKWDMRGRQKGQYVMCRFGDVGAYEVGNVYIATCSHNCSHQPNNPNRKSKSPKKKRDAAEREIAS